ncbi:predicted protein, partial [Micromonas commoda]
FHSRVWITYRRGFPQIGGGTYTTDAGWGCTLRSGQMLLANALQSHFFDGVSRTYVDLPGAPFSSAAGCQPTDNAWAPLVILVPLVLGLDRCVNPRYVPGIVRMLGLPQSVGILGGKPCASLYFVGAQDEELFYLDPHTVQLAVPLEQIWGCAQTGSPESGPFPTETYHCRSVLHMNARELDPSMVLGFYCRTRADF